MGASLPAMSPQSPPLIAQAQPAGNGVCREHSNLLGWRNYFGSTILPRLTAESSNPPPMNTSVTDSTKMQLIYNWRGRGRSLVLLRAEINPVEQRKSNQAQDVRQKNWQLKSIRIQLTFYQSSRFLIHIYLSKESLPNRSHVIPISNKIVLSNLVLI